MKWLILAENPKSIESAGDDKATQVLPQTPEGLPGVAHPAKSEKTQPTPGSIKRNIKVGSRISFNSIDFFPDT